MAGSGVRVCDASLAVAVAVAVACLYQVSLNWRRFQEGATWLAVEQGSDAALTPPITLCAFPYLDPHALLSLGLRLHASNISQARMDMETLAGVPADTPVQHLTETGAWGVDRLVREVRVGDLREEYSPGVASHSSLWEEVLLASPCIRLCPRPVHTLTNISITLQTKRQFLVGAGASSPQAKMARRLLSRIFSVSVMLPGVSPAYMTARTASPIPEFNNHFLLESYSVRWVARGDAPPAAACRASCYETMARSEGYCLILPPPATVGNSCTTVRDFVHAWRCLKDCRSDAFEYKWRKVSASQDKPLDKFHVQLLDGHHCLRQGHVYPASRLLSDLGGSLSLFLGLSMSSLLIDARRMGAAWGWRGWRGRGGQQRQRRGAGLYALSVYLAASLLVAVHTLSSLGQVAAPPRTSVRLVRSGDADSLLNLSLYDALSAHLASRAFGCRLSLAAEPLLYCLLEDTSLMPLRAAPFSLQDLPACSESVLHELPAIRYVLPVQLMTLKEMEVRTTLCQEKGVERDASHSVPVTPVTAYVTQEHPGVLRLLMDVGGIVGLYFGVSVYAGVRHVLSSRWGRRMKGGERRAARWAAAALVGVAAYACYVQVYQYLFRRPLSVVITSQPLGGPAPVSLTLCPWPPLNTTRLMTFADAAVDDDILTGHLQKGQPTAALLDAFMRNTSLLMAAWEAAEWRVEDLVDQYYDGERYRTARDGDLAWRTVAWAGRRCFTYTPASYKQNFFLVTSAEKSDVSLQYTVHAAGEPPLLGEPFIKEQDDLGHRHKVVSALTTYRSLGQEHGPSLGDCYHRCTQAAAMAEAGCVPPPDGDPLAGSATHLFCNSSVARRLVLWALRNVVSELPPPLELVADQREACLFTCRRSPRTLLTLKVNGQEMTAPSFTIHTADSVFTLEKDNHLDARALLTEYDAYPLANLLSDAGSLLGILLGMSVLSAGKWLLGIFKRTPSPQDIEAEGTTVQEPQ